MVSRRRLWVLALLAAAAVVLFLVVMARGNWGYVLPRRAGKIAAMVLTGTAIAGSTVVFQTITHNRILTPSIIGLDSLYLLLQTVAVFLFGSWNLTSSFHGPANFLLSVGLMALFSGGLHRLIFGRGGRNMYFLLLFGLILGTLFQSLSTVMQVLMDPNEFLIVQDRMFASFNNIRTDLLLLAAVLMVLIAATGFRHFKYLDVLALGRDHAVSLGVPYDQAVKNLLRVVALLTSVATALVGPITFLGLLVANLAYQILGTSRHGLLLVGASLVAVIALAGGQLVVERVFTFATTLSVIVNFAGGVYFITLLLRESRAW